MNRSAFLAASLFACMLMAACGGGSSETQPVAYSAKSIHPLEPAGISPFGPLPSVQQVLRSGSATSEQRFKYASDFALGLTGASSADGSGLVCQPSFDIGADPPAFGFSWAVYQFNLPGYDDEPTLFTGWDTSPDPGSLWLGLGRNDSLTWDWELADSGLRSLEDLSPYLHGGDKLVTAMVLLGTREHRFDWLRFGGPVEPVAELGADPLTGSAPQLISFDASGSRGRGRLIENVEWDFDGNGEFNEEANGELAAQGEYQPQFTYPTNGEFNPAVRVTDGAGLSAEASVGILLEPATYGISGTVFESDGTTPLPGAAVVLSGDLDDSTATDAGGYYSFAGLEPGSYTVQANIYGKFFDPWDVELAITDSDITGQDFIAVDPWLRTWGGSAEDSIADIALDGRGNIYCVGRTMSFGSGGWEVLIVKYNYKAELQWAKTWGGGENEIGQCAVLGPSGDLYLTGYTTSFGAGGYDMFILRISPDGEIVWQKTWGNVALQEGFDIVLDASENLYVAGRLSNKAALVKFDSTGTHVWGQLYWADGSGFNYAKQLVLSGSNIYMGGFSYYSSPTSDYNSLVLKYTLDGDNQPTLDWAREWHKGSEDMVDQIVLDGDGNVIAAGHCNAGNGAQDGLILGYSSSGGLQFENVWGTGAFELFYDLIFDGANAYVAGMYGSSGRGLLGEVNPATGGLNFSRGFDMVVGSEVCTGYAVVAFENGVLLWGGTAPNINGSWGAVTGDPAGGAGSEPDPVEQENNTNTAGITQSDPGAALVDAVGIEDTGGGSSDFGLFMYVRPQE